MAGDTCDVSVAWVQGASAVALSLLLPSARAFQMPARTAPNTHAVLSHDVRAAARPRSPQVGLRSSRMSLQDIQAMSLQDIQAPLGHALETMSEKFSIRRPNGTSTLRRIQARTGRAVTRCAGSRISTDTLKRQVPTKTIAKTTPTSHHSQSARLLTGDNFPWIVGFIWVLALTGATDSAIPAIIIACIETFFFIYNTILAHKANAPATPEPMNRDLMELWDNCLTYSPDGAQSWLEGWFYDSPLSTLTKEDILEFLAWGSCSTTWEMLTVSSKAEMQAVYALFERKLNHEFQARQPGQTPAPFMAFSIEHFEYKFKPTSYYWVCSFLLGWAGKVALAKEGFSRHRSRALDYWIRVPEAEEARKRTPIVFVHGIGVGLVMYLKLVQALLENDCPVVCIELPFVSSKLGASTVPSISEQVASVEALCIRWGFDKAMFVGHSYGSVMLSWMALHLPERVAGLAFIDPVVIMLNLKNVLYNFLYKDDGEGGIADIIGTELGVNIALRRNFWWYRNILWASDLQKHSLPTVVCLSEKDEIGPARAVEKHIAQHAEAQLAAAQAPSVVESWMMDGASHGGFLFDPNLLQALSARISSHYAQIVQTQSSAVAAAGVGAGRARASYRRLRRSKSQERMDALLEKGIA